MLMRVPGSGKVSPDPNGPWKPVDSLGNAKLSCGVSRRSASSDVFRAISDPTRRRILDLLSGGERPLGELARQFQVTLSAISQQMRILRDAGLVTVRRAGRERHYRLNPDALQEVANWVGHYERFWQQKLAALGEQLEKNE
jgi:DNA-binding transcriptional ArsR family regulator